MLGRAPTDVEVASKLGVGINRLRDQMASSAGPTAGRLDDAVSAVEDVGSQPDRLCARSRMRELLDGVMSGLPARYRSIMELYYRRELTMREIGLQFGSNESRVSQIHKRSLQLMAGMLASIGIRSSSMF